MKGDARQNLVSVIIPTFNRAHLIRETIDSVLKQTYQNFEIIIVDDGSTDNTAEVVKSYSDPRISYFYQPNSGLPAKARNVGLTRASGEFIAFLDSDDIWFPRKIERQLTEFAKNPELLGIGTNVLLFPGPRKIPSRLPHDSRLDFKTLLKGSFLYNSSFLIRRSVIEAIGFLDEDCRLRAAEDFDYWLRILHYRDQSILLLREVLTKYRVHPSSIGDSSSSLRFLRIYRTKKLIYAKYPALAKDASLQAVLKHDLSVARVSLWRASASKHKSSIIQLFMLPETLFFHKMLGLIEYCLVKKIFKPIRRMLPKLIKTLARKD